jgi:hypothetical protein
MFIVRLAKDALTNWPTFTQHRSGVILWPTISEPLANPISYFPAQRFRNGLEQLYKIYWPSLSNIAKRLRNIEDGIIISEPFTEHS